MAKLNTVLALFIIALSSSVEFHSATPLSPASNSAHPKAINSTKHTILSFSISSRDLLLNGTSKVNSTTTNHIQVNRTSIGAHNSTSDVHRRSVYALMEWNSWFVAYLMRPLQNFFGKSIVPDSKIMFLQTIVNPMFPFNYAKNLEEEIKKKHVEPASSTRLDQDEDQSLNEIMKVLKPKIVTGLIDLMNSGILEKLHPLVHLTVEIMRDYQDQQNAETTNYAHVSHPPVALDLIDYEEFKKQYSNSNEEDEIVTATVSDLLISKEVYSTPEQELNSTNLDDDVIANSSLIDKQPQEPTQSHRLDVIHREDKINQLASENGTETVIEFRDSKQQTDDALSQAGDLAYKVLAEDAADENSSTDKPIEEVPKVDTAEESSPSSNNTSEDMSKVDLAEESSPSSNNTSEDMPKVDTAEGSSPSSNNTSEDMSKVDLAEESSPSLEKAPEEAGAKATAALGTSETPQDIKDKPAKDKPVESEKLQDDIRPIHTPLTNKTIFIDPNNRTVVGIIDNKFNNTEYMVEDKFDLDKPILSLLSCDGDKCHEEMYEGPENGSESDKQVFKPTGSLGKDIKKFLASVGTQLIVNPASFFKERFVRLNNVIVRDVRLTFKMLQAIFGFGSLTCRHKFVCLFSSFFSLHTPDYIKANMPTAVENYYIQIMEAANRNEFLNALVTGYIGFDCNDFYNDKRCPE